ncbi:MAG TPA: DEAD/DEAH box helicase family protein [Bacteroidales bacterium]|nr:DEAD/DEAH box helicase family protein [Bacteroidales bacterium]
MVTICKHDFLNIRIETEDYRYLREVRDFLSAYIEGYQWMPAFTHSGWNGKVSMLNLSNKTIPYGLLIDFIKFHKKFHKEIELKIEPDVLNLFRGAEVSPKYNLSLLPHYYQEDCINAALKYKRGIIRSATASGKSLVISYIIKTLFENKLIKKVLIIVPTISLVEQFYDDLLKYGYFTKTDLGKVYEKYKEFQSKVVISTWQTLSRNHKLLQSFDCLICDETHGAKAHEIKKILSKCTKADYRLGFTGTLPTPKIDMWNIKAYLGPILREYGAGQLGDEGYISKCNVKIVCIHYKRSFKGTYDEIKDAVFKTPFRLDVIREIIKFVDKNILILVHRVEKEGMMLKQFLEENPIDNREIVFLYGKSKVEEREFWRKECEKRNDIILIATYGIFQLGINIPSLKYIILASPFKSKIRVLQSIGRSLRKHLDKLDGAFVFDIFDNCKYLRDHGIKRERYYNAEGFKIEDIILEEGSTISQPFV